ncbi:hypothetical protein HPB49_024429 [Dermacentor silvarum]|uniref:Uncharacterized protein n=1 Tax=Dermacentor silvarum TaxID=543639 RepID=A0ACB8CTY4_DERSI|nr:hypothetical protein HPB49_024429 [Dermacentor silvarum]
MSVPLFHRLLLLYWSGRQIALSGAEAVPGLSAYDDPVRRTNLYFDELLAVALKEEAAGLDTRPLPAFAFAFGRLQRHVANFTRIKVAGLSGGVQRYGDASAPGYLRGNLTTGSYVRFVDAYVHCGRHVRLNGAFQAQFVDLQLLLKYTVALVEVMGFPEDRPNLLTFQLVSGGVNLTAVSPDRPPAVDEEELRQLMESGRAAVRASTEHFLNTEFRAALQRAVARKPMPKP